MTKWLVLWWLIYAMSYKRENPPIGDFVGFSHGDLSPRQAKIRQTVAENATHEMSRTFVWRGEGRHAKTRKRHHLAGFRVATFRVFAPVCRENTPNGDFVGFLRGDLLPRQAKIRQIGGEKATHEKCRTFVWRGEISPCENT